MRIIVCVKQVPASIEVKLDPVTSTIMRDSTKSILNPFDEFALEEATRLKETFGGSVHAISMGIPSASSTLQDAMSLGADSASLLSDRAFAGSDTLATGYALSMRIKEIKDYDLIICGRMATDGDTAQVPPIIAQYLNIPCITDVSEIITIKEGEIICRRVDDDYYSIFKAKIPALITVTKECNIPRLPSIQSLLYAIKEEIPVYKASDFQGIDQSKLGLKGSPTQVRKTFVPDHKKSVKMIDGEAMEQALSAWEVIRSTINF